MLLLLPIAFSEILIETTTNGMDGHQFVVNKYYFQQIPQMPIEEGSAILILPNITEKTINQCTQAEFSFKLGNPTKETQTYSIGVEDFEGIAYISPNVIIPGEQVRKINLILMPECDFIGKHNPKVIVETTEERAEFPLLLDVLPVDVDKITPYDCLYYYNESVCNSDRYIRFYQGTKYIIDLDELFYDPDGDKLDYSADSLNLNVKIRNSKATITPLYDFYGSEQIVFYAEDPEGGTARSEVFYFHVLSNGRSYIENFVLLNMSLILGFFVLIIVILFLIFLIIRPKNRQEKQEDKEKISEPPKPPKKEYKARKSRKLKKK